MAGSKKKPSRKRSRTAPSKAKSEQAETRKASTDNREPLIKKDRVKHHLDTIEGYKGKIAHLTGHMRKAFEVAKADGLSSTTINRIISAKKKDPLELRLELEHYGLGLEVIGVPVRVVVHDSLFGDSMEQAKAEGRSDGKAGRSANCRYAEDTPEYKAFFEAYAEEQAKYVTGATAEQTAEEDVQEDEEETVE